MLFYLCANIIVDCRYDELRLSQLSLIIAQDPCQWRLVSVVWWFAVDLLDSMCNVDSMCNTHRIHKIWGQNPTLVSGYQCILLERGLSVQPLSPPSLLSRLIIYYRLWFRAFYGYTTYTYRASLFVSRDRIKWEYVMWRSPDGAPHKSDIPQVRSIISPTMEKSFQKCTVPQFRSTTSPTSHKSGVQRKVS